MNKTENIPPLGQGVRKLKIIDQLPECTIHINRPLYDFKELVRGKRVADIGCGFGRNRPIVESVEGEWVGVEPFEGGGETVVASAEDLPFEDASFDVVVMDAVLEHIPDVGKAFNEVSRILKLKPGGLFVGYVAFMECFHEISYSHLSFKALEHYSTINNMKLEALSGGGSFGIDYHLHVLFYPLPLRWIRRLISSSIRGLLRVKTGFSYIGLRIYRKMDAKSAKDLSASFYKLECLRQSTGFEYKIRKLTL